LGSIVDIDEAYTVNDYEETSHSTFFTVVIDNGDEFECFESDLQPVASQCAPRAAQEGVDVAVGTANGTANGPQLEGYYQDELGRLHVSAPRNGPMHVSLRACKFHQSTAATNAQLQYNLTNRITKALPSRSVFRETHDNSPDSDLSSWAVLL
jgi:hypothetical protein